MARMLAVSRAMAGPFSTSGTFASSSFSRTLANSTNAKAKPTAEALQKIVDLMTL